MRYTKFLIVGFISLFIFLPTIHTYSQETTGLSGYGDTATDSFYLGKGATVFNFIHDGDSNFIVKFYNKSTGQLVDLLVNQIGSFKGEVMVGIKTKGNYLLNVTADGSWEVNITQLNPSSGATTPLKLSGQGFTVTNAIKLTSGLATFSFSHEGSSNFIVMLRNQKGRVERLLVNKIGGYEGEKVVPVPYSGLHYLSIAADGQWNIAISS